MRTNFGNFCALSASCAALFLACSVSAQTFGERPRGADRVAAGEAFTEKTGAQVLWDTRSDLPARVEGSDIRIATSLDASTASDAFLRYLDAEAGFFGIPVDQLALMSTLTRDDRIYLKYQFTFEGLPIEGQELGAVLETDGDLIRYASNILSDLSLSSAARVSEEEARQLASAALLMRGLRPASEARSVERVFLPDMPAQSDDPRGSYRLIYRVETRVEGPESSPFKTILIDASTGELISVEDTNPWTITGTIRGEIVPLAATDPPVLRDLDNVFVLGIRAGVFPGISTTLATDGDYTLPTSSGTWTLVSSLDGPFASVDSIANAKVSETTTATDGATANWTWRTTNGDDLAQINVFYHLNLIHDDLYKAVLNYNWKNAWQSGSSQFQAETGHSFNNAYAGDPMTFGTTFALRADVIYHEASHNVIYSLFNGWVGHGKPQGAFHEAYAFDEGFADFFSAEMLDRSQTNGRNLDNTLSYADRYTPSTGVGLEGHQGGQIIGGVAWDLRELLRARFGDDFGIRLNTALIFKALHEMAASPGPYRFSLPTKSNFLESILRADDNDKDTDNGTPRDREIFQAFRNHRALPVDLFIRDHASDQGDVPSNSNGEPWWVSPDIIVQDSPLNNVISITHDLPKFKKETWIRVRVRNDGYLTSGAAKVHVYSRGLSDPTYVPRTKLGTVTINNVPPNGSKLSPHIVWKPEPLQILWAEVESAEDMMTEPGNIVLENNFAQRSLTTVMVWPGKSVKLPYPYARLTDPQLAEKLKEAGASLGFEVWHEADNDIAEIEFVGDDARQTASVVDMKPQEAPLQFAPLVAATGSPVWTEDERVSPLVMSEDPLRFAGHANPRLAAELTPYSLLKYGGGTFGKTSVELEGLIVTIADNAKPGDVLHIHMAHSADGAKVGGMTYEIVVAERTSELETRLETQLRGPFSAE